MPNAQEAQPTQQFVEIDHVNDGVVFLKTGTLRQILIVSGINFDLKSEDEQRIIIASYQNLLNSLKFSLQFFVHSRNVNIESYLAKIEGRMQDESHDLLRNQIKEYIEFIRSFVGQNPIMSKTFFVVVPFDPMTLPQAARSFGQSILGLFGRKARPTINAEEVVRAEQANMEQLSQRVSQVVSGLAEVGLRAVPLENEEVTELFYNLYNPESRERKVQMPDELGAEKTPRFNAGSLNIQQGLEAREERGDRK